MLGVVLCGVLMMLSCMQLVPVSHMCVVRSLVVVVYLMRVVGLTMVMGSGLQMVGCVLVVLVFAHNIFLKMVKCQNRRKHYNF